MIHQNASESPRRDCKEVGSVLPVYRVGSSQANVHLVDKSCGAEGMVLSFATQVICGEPVQFVVSKLDYILTCLLIAFAPVLKKGRQPQSVRHISDVYSVTEDPAPMS